MLKGGRVAWEDSELEVRVDGLRSAMLDARFLDVWDAANKGEGGNVPAAMVACNSMGVTLSSPRAGLARKSPSVMWPSFLVCPNLKAPLRIPGWDLCHRLR